MNILIIGNCGVGKTYIMQEIIKKYKSNRPQSTGQLKYSTNDTQVLYSEINETEKMPLVNVTGVYDGSMFQGSDRLSMSVMSSVDDYLSNAKGVTFYEGDRFTNNKFILKAKPFVIKILGSGSEGRALRGSSQSERQIKSISTRVNNINADIEVENSGVVLSILEKLVNGDFEYLKQNYKTNQQSLF